MSIIFKTIHGSRLYGLENDKSDHDYYTVVTNDHVFAEGERGQRVRSFADKVTDEVVITLDDFLKRVRSGSHQAIEALFSDAKTWGDEKYRPMLDGMLVTSPEVFAAYERTIRKFAFGDFKRRRHGARLALNLSYLRTNGRFNSRLNRYQVVWVTGLAQLKSGNALLRELDIPLSDNYAETQTNEEGES